MKTKGFTLVELLVVIVIVALLLVITIPTIMNSRNNAMAGISKEQENNIKQAGMMLGIDLDDYMSSVYNCKRGSWIEEKCTKPNSDWIRVTIPIEKLKRYNYFTSGTVYSGDVTVSKVNSEIRVSIDSDDVIASSDITKIETGGKKLGTDLNNKSSSIYNCKVDSWIEHECTMTSSQWVEVTVSIDDLTANGYFKDAKKKCSGEITVARSDTDYNVTYDSVECE